MITIEVGATASIRCTLEYSDGTSEDLPSRATWQTDDTAIATVNASGVVRGVSVGDTDLVVRLDSVTSRFQVTVIPVPEEALWTVRGQVTDVNTGAAIRGAVVRITSGAQANKTATTNSAGRYALVDVSGNMNISVTAESYNTLRTGFYVGENQTRNFELEKPKTQWTRSGTGNTVFDKPRSARRVRVVGEYAGRSQNFIVHCGGRGLVNVILGTSSFADGRRYNGVHNMGHCGEVEIVSSSGVKWSFTEQ